MKPLGKRSLLLVLTLVLAVGLAAVVWAEAPKGAPKGARQGDDAAWPHPPESDPGAGR